MLLSLIGRILRSKGEAASVQIERKIKLENANKLMVSGDIHGAIEAYKSHLQEQPKDVEAINNLGVCLGDVGDSAGAGAAFELAYSLDDVYLPGVINHAKNLFDHRRSGDALPFLLQAWSCDSHAPGIYLVYAGIQFKMGNVKRAREIQLHAWLVNFDSMRYANNYLFMSSYDDIDEKAIASEHRFWAETLRPLSLKYSEPNSTEVPTPQSSKIRIGYWSPDFRHHSVRYFFRALLENHDRDRFEIYLYHDNHANDAQTELIKLSSDHFHDVYKLTDSDLFELVKSHQLDIFVELAGHTSANRVAMLQYRFAKLQVSALGYPPTTGLSTVDAKLMDRYLIGAGFEQFYSEAPLALPESFWCFDPMERVPVSTEPPVEKRGYVTFACVGNIAKINERILGCWRSILERVPSSRLLIRAINFEDPAVEGVLRKRIAAAGIDISRVDLRKPEVGDTFFASYSEIDLILDTFPFNGGTTTCFAVYMGVPVVSLVGSSVLSRMGLSILSNVGFPEMAVYTEEDYINQAVFLASNPSVLRHFRETARARLNESSLGNGKLFARDFEHACRSLLEQKNSGNLSYQTEIPILPPEELVRRANVVLGSGGADGAMRILNHCLRHYPNTSGAHFIVADLVAREMRFDEAEEYLVSRLDLFEKDGKIGALLRMIAWDFKQNKNENAFLKIRQLEGLIPEGLPEVLQMKLFVAYENYLKRGRSIKPGFIAPVARRIDLLIPTDEVKVFEGIRQKIQSNCHVPDGWLISFHSCKESKRKELYESVLHEQLSDVVVILQKNVDIYEPDFFTKIVESLIDHDLVGIAGADRWEQLDWRCDGFHHKSAAYLSDMPGSDQIEVRLYGDTTAECASGMAILDGHCLAANASKLREHSFDPDLQSAGLLLEERWSYLAHQSALRLAVRRDLGVIIHQELAAEVDLRDRSPGVMKIMEELGFEPFSMQETNNDCVFMSFSCAETTLNVLQMYFRD